MILNRLYYSLKPLIPRSVQIFLRRQLITRKRKLYSHVWPINPAAGKPPDGWPGWPEHKKFALVLTHDVDTACGQGKSLQLMEIEKTLGFSSSFYFVPERYEVSHEIRKNLTSNGFEVGVHGLKHDGKLYASKKIFQERAIRIDHYLKEWKSVGFRSPSMHHNLNWLHELNIEHDASTFDNCPFEPQSDGVGTIFPFAVFKKPADDPGSPHSVPSTQQSAMSYELPSFPASSPRSISTEQRSEFNWGQHPSFYVELPYTLPQDHILFIIMREENIDIWKQKLDWIAEKGGMALMLTHPDYMNFGGMRFGIEEYPGEYYEEFLKYIKSKYRGQYWHALPKDIAQFWVSKMLKPRSQLSGARDKL